MAGIAPKLFTIVFSYWHQHPFWSHHQSKIFVRTKTLPHNNPALQTQVLHLHHREDLEQEQVELPRNTAGKSWTPEQWPESVTRTVPGKRGTAKSQQTVSQVLPLHWGRPILCCNFLFPVFFISYPIYHSLCLAKSKGCKNVMNPGLQHLPESEWVGTNGGKKNGGIQSFEEVPVKSWKNIIRADERDGSSC